MEGKTREGIEFNMESLQSRKLGFVAKVRLRLSDLVCMEYWHPEMERIQLRKIGSGLHRPPVHVTDG